MNDAQYTMQPADAGDEMRDKGGYFEQMNNVSTRVTIARHAVLREYYSPPQE